MLKYRQITQEWVYWKKAAPSTFVQDHRPITDRQGRAVIAGLSSFCQGMFVVQWHSTISIPLKCFKFYWLTKPKCAGLTSRSWEFFSLHEMTAVGLCLAHQRGSSAPLPHSCPVSFTDSPELFFFSVFPIPELSEKSGASCNGSVSASSHGKGTAGSVAWGQGQEQPAGHATHCHMQEG